MALDVSPLALIRAGSGLLFMALGVALLVTRYRERPAARWLAVMMIPWGLLFVLRNVVESDPDLRLASIVVRTFCYPFVVAGLIGLAATAPRSLRRDERAMALALLGVAVAAAVFVDVTAVPGLAGDARQRAETIRALMSQVHFHLLSIAPLFWALRAARSPPEDVRERALLARLSLALSLYVAFEAGFDALGGQNGFLESRPALAFLFAGMVVWLWNARRAPSRSAVVAALAIPACALVGIALFATVPGEPANRDLGGQGIVRIVGWVVLVTAILKDDLFGSTPTPGRVSRASAAVGALAALFIVAQVAQNFLSAEYGLLTGGVVAGAFLFAARPLERALEGRRELRAQPQLDANAKEDAYRAAVRMALRDRKITREEELHLHRVAQHMGILTGRAHELLIEVEREEGSLGRGR